MNKMKEAMDRRSVVKSLTLGTGALGMFGGASHLYGQVADNKDARVAPAAPNEYKAMKITKVKSVNFSDKINIGGGSVGSGRAEFYWVRLHTDRGIVGTGETYPFSQRDLGALKDYSRLLIGNDPLDIDGIWKRIYHDMNMRNAGGADMCILSAINMAQLDILGKVAGLPAYGLLWGGGRPGRK